MSLNVEWPSPPIPETIKTLVTNFYLVSDSRAKDAPQQLGREIFTPAGQIITGRRKFTGTEEIVHAQESLWGAVKSRVHHIHKVYSTSPEGHDLMVFGVVEWTFIEGKVVDGAFVSRFIVKTSSSNGPRIELFQAWADSKDV